MNWNYMAKKVAIGAVQGNLPEIMGAIGTWYTFKDKKYALELAMDQIKSQALVNSLIGGATPIVVSMMNKSNNNGSGRNNNKRRKNKNRPKQR